MKEHSEVRSKLFFQWFEICGLCAIDDIECALETYDAREPGTQLAANCYSRLSSPSGAHSISGLIIMKIEVLINSWSFDFSRHERDLGGFK